MASKLIYAVVCNRGQAHYLKSFQDMDTFVAWGNMMRGSVEAVKHWRGRPPCKELTALKEQFKETWIKNP